MIIIPAIDIMDGRCVRLSQGDFAKQKIYSENPVDVALTFQKAGLKYLHVVDLDGAKEGKVKHWDVLRGITAKTNLKVDFGGGIKTSQEIEKFFELGVEQVNLGSIAMKEPAKVKDWINKFGSDKIILSADVMNKKIAVAGWQQQTEISVFDFINGFMEAGLHYVTCTDISKDGMLGGSNVNLYKEIFSEISKDTSILNLIASGGIGSLKDLQAVRDTGCYGCIVGKAIYEGSIALTDLVN